MSLEMERWLEMQNPSLRKSLSEVELNRPALHLSANKSIKIFTPRIPKSLYDGEDQTIARVSVSNSLTDTMIGASWNFECYAEGSNNNETSFTIYALDVPNVIRPTVKLTKESNATGELWIVPDRMSNYEVPSRVAAELCINWVRHEDDTPEKTYFGFVLEVSEDIALTGNKILKPGFYSIREVCLGDILGKKRDFDFVFSDISRDTFLEGKQNTVVI